MDGLSDGKSGLQAALAENFSPNDPVPGSAGAAVQPSLLLLCQDEGAGQAENQSPGGRGPGRPAGSKNKSTEEWRNFILSRHSSPLQVLADVMSSDLLALAEQLGFKTDRRVPTPDELLELFKVKMQCAKELLPYLHQKQPLAVENKGNGLMQLVINTSAGVDASQASAVPMMPINFIDVKSESEQSVSEDENGDFVAGYSDVSQNDQSKQDDNANKQADLESVGLTQDGGAE